MKKVLVRLLAVIGGLVVLAAVAGLGVWIAVRVSKGAVPGKTVLEANLETELIEDVPDDPAAKVLLRDRLVVRDLVEALERAGNDDRVAGLIARVGAVRMGMAQVQEIRNAVQRFRARKKFAVAFAETFGEFGPGNNSYYLATAFDQIWLQPSGDIGLTGLLMESPFIRGALEKLGMKFHGDHRYEYKNALNFLTEKKYTPAHREAMEKVMNSWFSQVRQGISEGRHIPPDHFQSLIDRGPYLAKEALDAKLADGLAYRDEVYDQAKKKAGAGARLLYVSEYLSRAGRPHTRGRTIALVYGVGGVERGKSDYNPVTGATTMGSDTVAGALRAASEDNNVKAILFRVDSPGGSYVASDAIWREVVRARKAGKPVVISMGTLAGSGGYFVAMAADKIVAQPGTITASIGVLGGKMLTSGLWDKVGLSWDEVHDGANATMWTGTQDYTKPEWARFQAWLDRIYVDFTSKVAEGRRLPKERILEIAKGRIWTGEDAKALGLVDELGGFPEALNLAKKAAGIPETEEVKLEVFPRKKNLLQVLLSHGGENSEREAAAEALVRALRLIQPVAHRLSMLQSGANPGVLSIPEIQPR
jgi:protease IV